MDVSQFSLFDTLTSLEEISNMFTTETETLEEEEEEVTVCLNQWSTAPSVVFSYA